MQKIVLPLIFIFLFHLGFSQANPFEKYDLIVPVKTLSGGRFEEFHDQDTIVRIGSIMFNRMSRQVIGLVEPDTTYAEYDLSPYITSRWMSPDPLAHEFTSWSPYNFVKNNPIIYIDPDGRAPIGALGEFIEKTNNDGSSSITRISDLGDDIGLDIIHKVGGKDDGRTELTSQVSGESQLMKSSKNMLNFANRGDDVNWSNLKDEFFTGTGPEKSMMGPNSVMIEGILDSPTYIEAQEKFKEKGKKIYGTAPDFNPLHPGNNMTSQFIGKANFSFYDLGDKTVVTVMDSKSETSWKPWKKGNESNNIPRKVGKIIPNSTTHQTYLFAIPNTEE